MDWTQITGWLLAGMAVAVQWLWRHKARLLQAAAEAVAFAEKYKGGAAEAELEERAVAYVRQEWPGVSELAVRLAIRQLCRRRRAAAEQMGVRG